MDPMDAVLSVPVSKQMKKSQHAPMLSDSLQAAWDAGGEAFSSVFKQMKKPHHKPGGMEHMRAAFSAMVAAIELSPYAPGHALGNEQSGLNGSKLLAGSGPEGAETAPNSIEDLIGMDDDDWPEFMTDEAKVEFHKPLEEAMEEHGLSETVREMLRQRHSERQNQMVRHQLRLYRTIGDQAEYEDEQETLKKRFLDMATRELDLLLQQAADEREVG